MNEHKLKVFLCHASQDKSTVRNIYQKLLAEDWIEPWLDEKNLLPGQDWDLEIEKAVGTADVVIVFLSEHSIKKEGYVQKELSKILDKADFMPEGKIFIIPLRLDDCSIPKRLKKFHYVNYFPVKHIDLAYRRLIASLGTQKRKIYKDTDEFTDKSDLLSSRNLLSETLLFEDVDPQSEPYLNFDDSSKNVHTIKSKRKLINLGFSETQFSIYKKSIKENVDYIAWYTTIVVVSIFVVYYFIFTSINQETGTFKLLGLAISWWQAMEGLGYFVLLPILGLNLYDKYAPAYINNILFSLQIPPENIIDSPKWLSLLSTAPLQITVYELLLFHGYLVLLSGQILFSILLIKGLKEYLRTLILKD